MTRSRSRALYWAGVGATLGFLVGLFEYGSKSVLGAVDYDHYPAQELKIAIVTVAGLVAGLVSVYFPSWVRRSRSARCATDHL